VRLVNRKGGRERRVVAGVLRINVDSTLVRRGRGTGPVKRSTIIGKNIGLAAYRLRAVGILAAV
jgi:hypothetical protein